MIDKFFCASSYLAFRYLWKDDVDFYDELKHQLLKLKPDDEKVAVKTAKDIDDEIRKVVDKVYTKYKNVGILLSGGMDSAIVASYLKPGSHAYTFVSKETAIFDQDQKRAQQYCEKYGLQQHLIEVTFDDFKKYLPLVMKRKGAPVHSIEPQIVKAAEEAKKDGVEIMAIGDGADYVFGGMDKLLAKEWTYNEFVKRYIYIDPEEVLKQPDEHALDLFKPYAQPNGMIDYMGVMLGPNTEESYNSYWNAFEATQMPYFDPYEDLVMAETLDLYRVRNGESKYLIRELFKMRYPEFEVPEKIPMPRPVDLFFKDWEGPRRPEFRNDINMSQYTGNQKWLMWCLEQFFEANE